ncbi:MAG: hypothetical protein SVV80_06255 [Planctomycetota bacterium]|nr:hypothetical protein [Planctomycetota bacterium]
MAIIRVLPLLWTISVLSVASGAEVQTPSAEDRLSAESLTHEARSLWHMRSGSTPARVGRTLALLRYARRLYPSGEDANRQLIDLYEGVGDMKDAAAAAEACVVASPEDYACGVRWIRLVLQGLNTADKRVGFLKSVVDNEKLSDGIRAAAAVGLCKIYQGQSRKQDALLAAEQALRFDAHEPAALQMQAKIAKRTAPDEVFVSDLAAFGSNPRSMYTSEVLAKSLKDAGLYEDSLIFYEHAFAIAEATSPPDDEKELLLVDYFNAMLDAGQAEKAIAFFTPHLKRYSRSLKLLGLMVEAHRSVGRDDQAAAYVETMARIYGPLSSPGVKLSGPSAAELGWFDLVYRSRPAEAIQWAKSAALSDGDNLFVQRVLGAAELAVGQTDEGTKRLARLIEKDPYAAAVLAEYYYLNDKADEGAKALLKTVGNIRTGPAWRAMKAVAAKYKVKLPPAPHADRMSSALTKLPAHLLDMGRYPERFVSVKLIAPKIKVAPGEPVAVTIVMENTSKHPVPLGVTGLFNPSLFLSVTVEGTVTANLPNLTLLTLPAPKYLAPGKKVSRTVRVDVGEAEEMLTAHPLAEMKLTVQSLLDPLQTGKQLFSSAQGIKITPVTIYRTGLFDVSGGEKSARMALGYIVRDLKQGSPAEQMRAARQTASLLGYVCRSEVGKAKPILPKVLTRPILMSMTKAFLEARSSVVRAEMLAALRWVDLDAQLISLMAPIIQDASGLVRMRLIELLAAKRTRGYRTLLDHFAADSDEIVREMTKAMREQKD